MADFLQLLNSELLDSQIELPATQKESLARYCSELEKWNQKINLTGLNGVELVRRLVVEPVWVAKQLTLGGTLVDIGSGNGSPAIPMRVVSELSRTHLVEVRAKRVAFLRHIVSSLKLGDVDIHHERFTWESPQLKDTDWVTLQAVALTAQLIEDIRRISHSTTRVVWITADANPPIEPTKRLHVPNSRTEVLVFRLDHS